MSLLRYEGETCRFAAIRICTSVDGRNRMSVRNEIKGGYRGRAVLECLQQPDPRIDQT